MLVPRLIWESPSIALGVVLLYLLCPSAAFTTVEDTDPGFHYDDTWLQYTNPYDSGGTDHSTNITGGQATYSFTGKYFILRPANERLPHFWHRVKQ